MNSWLLAVSHDDQIRVRFFSSLFHVVSLRSSCNTSIFFIFSYILDGLQIGVPNRKFFVPKHQQGAPVREKNSRKIWSHVYWPRVNWWTRKIFKTEKYEGVNNRGGDVNLCTLHFLHYCMPNADEMYLCRGLFEMRALYSHICLSRRRLNGLGEAMFDHSW